MIASRSKPPQFLRRRGMSLVELTIVLLVMLLLVGVLAMGANHWKNGTNRARCVMQIRQMQMSVRALSVVQEADPGTDLSLRTPPVNILGELVLGGYLPELPTCPSNGLYFFGADVVPDTGTLYMTCSLAGRRKHVPDQHGDW